MSVRKELETIIKSGHSVIFNGAQYTSIEDLPTEAELAKGDAEKEEAAKKNIKAQLRALSDQLASLEDDKEAKSAANKAASSASKAPEKADEKKEEAK